MKFYKKPKNLILVAIIAAIACFYIFDLQQYFSLEYVKSQQKNLEQFYLNNKLLSIVIYVMICIVAATLSIPVTTIVTLIGSAIFGFTLCLIITSFASTVGALFSFWIARYLLRDYFQGKFGYKLHAVNEGVRKDGPYYLFALRMTPVIPFALINILTSLTPMKARTFYIFTQLGMLPDTIIVVYLGTKLAEINSISEVMSPQIMVALTALAVMPLLMKWWFGKRNG
jgi:uncharacterized membrane protein YdjX (TVP38/TMEM64 family)